MLVTVLLVVIGWHAYEYRLAGLAWGAAAALFASLIPFAVILRGVRRGGLSDHHVGRREQRRTPMVMAFGPILLVASPVIPVVAWSRIRLRDHTVAQTIVGAAVGVLVTVAAFALLR